MTKESWIEHMEDATGLTRPSKAPWNKEDWESTARFHRWNFCPECEARRKTSKANSNRQARHQVQLDCGLVRVKGNLGGIYYE